jgi:hypothetical protein
MADLTPDERQRIYLEEKTRIEAQAKLKSEVDAKRQKSLLGCFAIGLLALLAMWIIGTFVDDIPETPGSETTMAQIMAEDFIKQRLLAPASASFAGETAAYSGGNRYRVTGYVDSQNAFGAKLRKRFVCVVEKSGADNWAARMPCGLLE